MKSAAGISFFIIVFLSSKFPFTFIEPISKAFNFEITFIYYTTVS
jgi:hypothetical protein